MNAFLLLAGIFLSVYAQIGGRSDALMNLQPNRYCGQPSQPADVPEKTLPMPGEAFHFQGHEAFIIAPSKPRAGGRMPWVWYAPTLHGLPGPEERWMFERFLDSGIAVAGIDVGESYGSPDG